MENKIDKIIRILKESKVSSKRWDGKWCYWFQEEFEDNPEAEILLRKVLERELIQSKRKTKEVK